MQDKDLVAVKTMEAAAWRLHDLTITRLAEFLWPAATLRMVGMLPDMAEDAFDQLGGRNRIFQGDVIGNAPTSGQRPYRPMAFACAQSSTGSRLERSARNRLPQPVWKPNHSRTSHPALRT